MAINETGEMNIDERSRDSEASLSSSAGRPSNLIERFSFRLVGSHLMNNGIEADQNIISAAENYEVEVNKQHKDALLYSSKENGCGSSSSELMRDNASSSGAGASLRRLFSLSRALRPQLDKDLEDEIVSQAGDIGDRIVSLSASERESFRFDSSREQAIFWPIIAQEYINSCGLWSNDHPNTISPVSPLVSDIITPPLSTSHKKQEDEKKELPPPFEYIAYLVHMAVFGILGILTRFLLQKLFGSNFLGVTSDRSILYLDLPSNMVGSFLMGWFGVVFKSKISHMSDQLAVGLSTGYLGSLTTFSGWNQKMLDLSVNGHWVFAVLGYVIGLFLVAYSIIIGVETAKGFRWLLERSGKSGSMLRVKSFKSHLIVLWMLTLVWGGLWTTSGILEMEEFSNGGSAAQLWLGCLVGPVGVWMRWWLARLNGHGLGKGKEARWKWVPFGTLLANVSAACVMAALATTKKVVKTKNCETIVGGIQLGLMGCLSTVSTFMAEYNAMRESSQPWRAYAYAFITIAISFALGTLIYSLPLWTLGYT